MSEPSPAWLEAQLAAPARALGVELPGGTLAHLARYARLVLDWGARINLTGAKTAEALAAEHLADALPLLAHLPSGPFRIVDVGSGAGLPGIAVALLRPEASGTLLEPVAKKHAFLAHAIRSLELGDRLAARRERLEAHLEAGGRGAYDVAVSRAVWPAAEWVRRGAPLLSPGGVLLGLEGDAPSELPAGCERHPYALARHRRAVIVLRV
jgi:16S rRNA (guanine527-N7)-methyltransferase